MVLRYGEMSETELRNFKGGLGSLMAIKYEDDNGKILRGRLRPGSTIGLHTHEGDSEMIYVISGHGIATCDGVREKIGPGECHYCPLGHEHMLEVDGEEDLLFFAVVPKRNA